MWIKKTSILTSLLNQLLLSKILVHELKRMKLRIVEMVENREYFTFDDVTDLWPDLKNDQSTFLVILDELSNAACRMLRSSGAE